MKKADDAQHPYHVTNNSTLHFKRIGTLRAVGLPLHLRVMCTSSHCRGSDDKRREILTWDIKIKDDNGDANENGRKGLTQRIQ